MIDAIDLIFIKDLRSLDVELFGAGQIVTERLFDDDASPSLAFRFGELGGAQLLNGFGIKRGRRREVEDSITGGSTLLIYLIEQRADFLIRLRVVDIAGNVEDAFREAVPNRFVDAFGFRISHNRVFHFRAKVVVTHWRARKSDDRKLGRQQPFLG